MPSWGTDCPVSNLYVPRLVELEREYASKGVIFVGINSNAHESEAEIRKHAEEYGINFPVVKDVKNVVADVGFVERTCEVLVLDGMARVRYRGAIDDQYGQGSRKPEVTRPYLREAIDAVLAGKPVTTPATDVVGCLLDREKPEPAVAKSSRPRVRPAVEEVAGSSEVEDRRDLAKVGKVSYTRDVEAIIQNKCQACHRPGQVGPFSLLTFEDADRHSAMIREVVDDRRMPPWHADARFGHFANDRRLSGEERATLLAWIDQGKSRGDAPLLPPEDLSGRMVDRRAGPRFRDPGYLSGSTPRRCGVCPTSKCRRISRRISGSRRPRRCRPIVRWSITSSSTSTTTPTPRTLRDRHLCGYAPGDMPSVYSPGTAKRIPAGADLIFEIHYTPNGKIRRDRSKLGLVLAKTPVTREAYTVAIANDNFLIPAHTDDVPGGREPDAEQGDPAPLVHAPHAPAWQAIQVHDHQAGRRSEGRAVRPRLRFRLAELLHPLRADDPAERDSDQLPGALRQFRRQPQQSRPHQARQLGETRRSTR